MSELEIYGINGPVITIKGKTDLQMMETVYIGNARLIGEVIGLTEERTTIQCYENTTGVRPGEPVSRTGMAMSATLGPGLLTGMYDGIGRPLKMLEAASGHYIAPGIDVPGIDTNKKWSVEVKMKAGDEIKPGDIYAECDETSAVRHRLIAPPEATGKVTFAAPDGDYTVNDTIIKYETAEGEEKTLTMLRRWPIRKPRPISKRLPITEPLITGQRVIDALFPIAKGGAAAIPGGFGTGKTMLQHQLAKWSDADIIVYVGCGERGNEMTQVLEEFSDLHDPRTGKSMLERTIMIANTSNMPVAAREASIYTGVTFAEYYRDMGYNVAMMADSTSRWAEALREISGRLEEMPAEEGYPAYLPSRLSAFYERAGYVETLSHEKASVSIIGAVSPQGNDFSEPVTQNTKRFIRCFWALEKALAYARHYPAVNWTTSYSEYTLELDDWFKANVAHDFPELRTKISNILSEENSLMDIVKLIGSDLLAEEQKLILETARVIRTGFLQQNAMHETDCYVPIRKQYLMMKYILQSHERAKTLVAKSIPVSELRSAGIFDILGRMKYDIPNEDESKFDDMWQKITSLFSDIEKKYDIK
ncbi:MAG: V-type ATP synthase subunit A [Eubacteriales bacterium]|nr:V-type ATP synthase subunit A [Eubacteriales bacterium]MDY4434125.1 V-type ATP synthase subunit A [Candidatus Flemingibacterium sp.]